MYKKVNGIYVFEKGFKGIQDEIGASDIFMGVDHADKHGDMTVATATSFKHPTAEEMIKGINSLKERLPKPPPSMIVVYREMERKIREQSKISNNHSMFAGLGGPRIIVRTSPDWLRMHQWIPKHCGTTVKIVSKYIISGESWMTVDDGSVRRMYKEETALRLIYGRPDPWNEVIIFQEPDAFSVWRAKNGGN